MSKFFLNSLGNTVESGKNESYCFLFPTELLFEHFVSGFLNSFLPANVSIKTQTTDQYLADLWINGQNIGKAFGLREDIVIQTERNTIILDTKYKEIQPLNHSRSKTIWYFGTGYSSNCNLCSKTKGQICIFNLSFVLERTIDFHRNYISNSITNRRAYSVGNIKNTIFD